MTETHPTVAVLMGGPSAEHDISLKSGHGVADALAQRGWPVTPLELPNALSTAEAVTLTRQWLQREAIAVVFIALHGPFGEDGTIQQVCEDLGIAYTGSGVEASRLGLDKVESRRRFERAGLRVPAWDLADPADARAIDAAAARLGFPIVVKPTNQGSSIGVSIANDRAALTQAIREAARYDTRILLEAFIRGREVTAGILDERPLPVIEIQSSHQFFDFTAKYTAGQTTYIVPAQLAEPLARHIQDAGLRAHRALGCRHLSRVDIMLTPEGDPVILEVNTIPGFTATSLLPKAAACVGIAYDALCERLVRLAIASRTVAGAKVAA